MWTAAAAAGPVGARPRAVCVCESNRPWSPSAGAHARREREPSPCRPPDRRDSRPVCGHPRAHQGRSPTWARPMREGKGAAGGEGAAGHGRDRQPRYARPPAATPLSAPGDLPRLPTRGTSARSPWLWWRWRHQRRSLGRWSRSGGCTANGVVAGAAAAAAPRTLPTWACAGLTKLAGRPSRLWTGRGGGFSPPAMLQRGSTSCNGRSTRTSAVPGGLPSRVLLRRYRCRVAFRTHRPRRRAGQSGCLHCLAWGGPDPPSAPAPAGRVDLVMPEWTLFEGRSPIRVTSHPYSARLPTGSHPSTIYVWHMQSPVLPPRCPASRLQAPSGRSVALHPQSCRAYRGPR